MKMVSLPVRGAWIEIKSSPPGFRRLARRSPCGERGLKLTFSSTFADLLGRSPCGERGLKSSAQCGCCRGRCGRSPCGERGLKFKSRRYPQRNRGSLPVRGAWIEMSGDTTMRVSKYGRSPCGERGLKL